MVIVTRNTIEGVKIVTYTWKTRKIEYRRRDDGLFNKWEQFHPSYAYNDTSYLEHDDETGEESPLVWVVTEVVEKPQQESES